MLRNDTNPLPVTRNLQQKNMKLREGHNYLFKLEGLVELPDGRLYHRLSDPNEIKHLF